MYIQTILKIFLLSFITAHIVWALENSRKFRKIFDCQGYPGCSENNPIDSRKGINSYKSCAFHCIRRASCVGFNYWKTTSLCQLFDFLPYIINGGKLCTHYQSYPEIHYSKTENLAEYRQTCQSTTYMIGSKAAYSWLAVDGMYGTDPDTGVCSHTSEGDSGNNWFMVDLVYTLHITYVRVLSRIVVNWGNILRYKNLTIGVTNDSWLIKTPTRPINYPICGIYLGPPSNGDWFEVYCKVGTPSARYVIVHQMPVDAIYGGYLCICEFQIFGDF